MRVPPIFLLSWIFWAHAQRPAIELPELTISATRITDSVASTPAAITVLESGQLLRHGYADISPAINTVPGVLMQSAAYNTNRISIRGIGARTPFGTNRIRAFYGPIPLTSGDGETTIDDLDLAILGKAEIVRGPHASTYGAGLGGAILFSPQIPAPNPEINLGTMHGSFGLRRNSISASTREIAVHYHHLGTDGWRQNSRYRRDGTTVTSLLPAKRGRYLILGNFTSLKAFIPSSIMREMFEQDPRAAAPTWLAARGFEQYDLYMAGTGYEATSGMVRPSISVSASGKKAYEPRPFDILEQQSRGWAVRGQLFSELKMEEFKWRFSIGGEFLTDRLHQANFENLYAQNQGVGSVEGMRIDQQWQSRSSYNGFFQTGLNWQKWSIKAGLNVNSTAFRNPATDSRFSFGAIWSPELSLSRHFRQGMLYASAGRGFSLPSVQETLDASRNFNRRLLPEDGISYEAGAKLHFLGRRLLIDFAAFTMTVRNLLVARRIADDQYIGVNAGRTSHRGIEFGARYDAKAIGQWKLSGFASGSHGRFTFDEFIDQGIDHSGKRLTGVPSYKYNLGMEAVHRFGFYASADGLFMGRVPANDDNSAFADNYRIANARLGYRASFLNDFTLDASAGMNNVLDEKYASMVQVNALAAPGQQPRFFYPGMPLNFYLHIGISYRLK